MKRADIVRLIRAHCDQDNVEFNSIAHTIAQEFDAAGAHELASYIMSLIAQTRTFVPQDFGETHTYLQPVDIDGGPLPIPACIADDLMGIINAASRNIGVNTFLFQGPPGTGKTESAKHLARILRRTLYMVDFNAVIDSRLGETSKNISALFEEVNQTGGSAIVLFDEIDALALDRINQHDVREMGRATSTLLRELDRLSENVVLIATTNLYESLDRALVRRFDTSVDFSRYTHEDLEEVGSSVMVQYASKVPFVRSDQRLFKKILHCAPKLPYPGELSNIIKSCIAFSAPDNPYDYLKRLYMALMPNPDLSVENLSALGFTLREIETLTGIPRSTVARMTTGGKA
ncbi:AAA family ATPase [Collinsella sp. An271]|uniref:ATP-binding protein n=1 Tax=Collinsella sp. An271 TaxID=1965616 RepID=UPI000B385A9C|nr:ATP-binding protein [Collinsella sp. An271]OUO58392.1 AAA family ATPase [Collinsella sp. An271]